MLNIHGTVPNFGGRRQVLNEKIWKILNQVSTNHTGLSFAGFLDDHSQNKSIQHIKIKIIINSCGLSWETNHVMNHGYL